jgi:hypothetical protein
VGGRGGEREAGALGQPLDPVVVQREAPAEQVDERLRAGRRERPEVIREPLSEVGHELLEQLEVGHLVRVVEHEVGPLREGAARAQLASPLLPEAIGLSPGAEPVERRVEGRRVEPEGRGCLGADGAGGADGVEDLVPLPGSEGVRHAVMRQQAVEVRVPDGARVGAPPARGERLDDAGALPAVPADELLEDVAPLVEEELVEEWRGGRRRRRRGLSIASPPHVERGAPALPPLGRRRLRGGSLGRRAGAGARARLAIAPAALPLGGDVRGSSAREIGEGEGAEGACGRGIGQQGANGEQLVP